MTYQSEADLFGTRDILPLKQTLDEIKIRVVTCDADNVASEKTILANGGVFEKTIDVEGTEMKRYWIAVMAHRDEVNGSKIMIH